ncbi:MAG TPA: hypothetical protein VI699_11870, partial [Candidatus Acidoferrales bacterium]|nr:hypothetical protein [Candidatus Acidoferrales bacterium]
MQRGVLFVSPSGKDAQSLSEMLQSLSIPVVHVPTLKHARVKLDHELFGVVLTEAALPDGNWKDVLDLARAEARGSAVVVTDPLADTRLWMDALDLGAYDLVCQPFCSSEVQRILSNALSRP